MALSLASCGDNSKNKTNGDEVNLTWVVPGPGKQTETDLVAEEINKKIKTYKGLENVNLKIENIATSDYSQKVMLMQTGGEQMDILGTYTLNYNDEVKKNTFLDITDLMKKYAPDVLNEIPDWALQLTQVDGKQYTITNYQQMSDPMWGYTFHKEDADQYLDAEALEKEARSSDILTSKTLDIFENYMSDLKKAGKLNQGMRAGSTWAMKGYVSLIGPYVYRAEADKVVVEHRLELDTLKMLSERFHDWFKKGYIRKDVLSAEVSKGNYDIWHEQWHKYSENSLTMKSKEPIKQVRSAENFHVGIAANAGGNGVTQVSKNPEEAVTLLNLMYSSKGKDLYRLIVYGIEGKHYKKISEDRMEPIGYEGSQAGSDAPYGITKWLMGNTANAFEAPTDPEGWNDYVFNDWNINAIPSPVSGIYINTESIDTKLTQCNNVCSEYIDQLTSGAMTDWTFTYKEAMNKLKIAGNDEVKAYLQKCVDEFIASKK